METMRQDNDILSHQFCGQQGGGTSTHVAPWTETDRVRDIKRERESDGERERKRERVREREKERETEREREKSTIITEAKVCVITSSLRTVPVFRTSFRIASILLTNVPCARV